eukprot:5703506-Pyramimonas_sp.AAC.1
MRIPRFSSRLGSRASLGVRGARAGPALSPLLPTAGNLAASARLQGASDLPVGRRTTATGRRKRRRRRRSRGAGDGLTHVQAQRAGTH